MGRRLEGCINAMKAEQSSAHPTLSVADGKERTGGSFGHKPSYA